MSHRNGITWDKTLASLVEILHCHHCNNKMVCRKGVGRVVRGQSMILKVMLRGEPEFMVEIMRVLGELIFSGGACEYMNVKGNSDYPPNLCIF